MRVVLRALDVKYEIDDLQRDNADLRVRNHYLNEELSRYSRENDLLRTGKRFWQTAFVGLALLAVAVVWPLIGTVVGIR